MEASPRYFMDPALYDAVYREFRADIPLHVREALEARGPVLEVCCGSGRVLVPMAEAGVDVDGLDADPAMLEELGRKLAERKLRSGLYRADMRDFTLPRRYALVVIPFNSFYHNLTQADQIATLRCCREHLEPGGRLSLVAFHPNAEVMAELERGEKLVKDTETGQGRRLRVQDSAHCDRLEQVNHVVRRIEILDGAGAVLESNEVRFDIRYCYKPEMELLLRVAGYRRWEATSGFDKLTDPAPFDTPQPPRPGAMLLWSAWRD